MILTSTAEAVRFTPPWLEKADQPPVYLFRAGSVRERGQLEAELAGPHRAGRVWGIELNSAIREGVLKLLANDPALDQVLGLIDEDDPAKLSEEGRQLIAEVRNVLAEHWQPYRDLVAQLARRQELVPIEAMRRFLVGFEHVDATYARGVDGLVSEATLAAIDPLEMLAAGNFAYSLLYGGGQERNFPQPSASESDQKTSSSAKPRAAGSSARKSGRKTPG